MRDNRTSRAADPEDEDSGLDLGNVMHTLRRKWWLLPLCLLCTVGLGVLYIMVTPKTFRSDEIVQVEQSQTKLLNIQELQAEDLKEDEILKTIEQNLLSGEVLDRVIKKLNLTPASLGVKPKEGATPEQIKEDTLPQAMIELLGKKVLTKLQRGTRLITVSADSTDPKLAQAIASTLVDEYIENDAAQRMGVSGEANRFLLTQAEELKKRVAIAEQAAQEYKDAHLNVALDDSQNYVEDKLRDLNVRKNEARQNRIRLEADYEQAQEISTKYSGPEEADKLLALQSVSTDPAVQQSEKDITDEEAELASIAQRYLPKHPHYIQEQSRLREFRSGLTRAVIKAAGGLGTAVASARDNEAQVEKVLKEAEKTKIENDRLAIPYASLTRELEANRTLYDSVQERLKETDLTANVDANNIRIVTPASLPFEPVKPKSILVLVGSTFVGLMLSLGSGFAFSMRDHSIKSVAEAENLLQLAAVGAIPFGDKFSTPGDGFPILTKPHTPLAESFRTLRTALDLLDSDDGTEGSNGTNGSNGAHRRSFLFTSAVPSEGKSFCSANYAIAVSQLGRKTLIVDADLRLPVLDAIFLKEKKTKGLSMLLEGSAPLEECYYPTGVPNLFFMPAGQRSQSPAELMANTKFPSLLKMMLAEFDRVIVDSAPVHAVSDTLLITKYVDATCLVVHAANTQVQVVQGAVQKLQRANSKLAGFILNRVPQNDSYYYYGGGSYGKGVYGAPDRTKAETVTNRTGNLDRA